MITPFIACTQEDHSYPRPSEPTSRRPYGKVTIFPLHPPLDWGSRLKSAPPCLTEAKTGCSGSAWPLSFVSSPEVSPRSLWPLVQC